MLLLLHFENETIEAERCEYMHSEDRKLVLWIDGPITCTSVALATVGTIFAIRFLRNSQLNKKMSAALYTLCLVDFMLMMTTILFVSIEASSILIFKKNIMSDKQIIVLTLYGVRNSFAMCSAMLVIYITYIRFQVVNNPLKFASNFNKAKRKSIASCNKFQLTNYGNPIDSFKVSLTFVSSDPFCDFPSQSKASKFSATCRRFFRPFAFPVIIVFCCFIIHSVSYFEFKLASCFNVQLQEFSTGLQQSELRSQTYVYWKAVFTSMTETIGPMFIISILSLFTEYRIHLNVLARRRLFESQKRSRDMMVTEELRDKTSKALAVFIVTKFLILRTLPTIIDIYELTKSEAENVSEFMEILTRCSDFFVFLNSASNTLAYFGKNRFEKCFRWLERRIRGRITKNETKRILNLELNP